MTNLVDEGKNTPDEVLVSETIRNLKIFNSLRSSSELQGTLKTILEHLDDLVSCDACVLLLLEENTLFVAASKGFQDTEQIEQLGFDLKEQPQLAQTLATAMPVVRRSGMMTSIFKIGSMFPEEGTCLSAPLVHKGRPLGSLLLFKKGTDGLTEKDARSTIAFANQAALAIENARLYTETRQRAAQLELASYVGQRIISILDPDELLSEVVRLIQNKLGYYHVHIFLVERDSNEIVLQELSGEVDEQLRRQGLRLKIGEQGITGWVAESRKPLLCNDVSQEPRYHPHELLSRTRSEVAVAMRVGDTVVGVLDVQSEQINAFQDDDVTTFQILADQIAIAIENARLFQETRRQVEFLSALHKISLEITSQLETELVLDSILKQVSRVLKVQGSVLWSYDPQKGVVRKIAGHKDAGHYVSPATIDVELKVGEGVPGQVIATQGPVFVNDYRSWQKRSPKIKGDPFNSVLGAPLCWQDQVIGALVVLDERDRRPFTKEDAQSLTLFADLASIALKNSEFYAATREAGVQLEQKVLQRTEELYQAEQALAKKAEQLRRLLRVTVNVQEEERTRIALDLHDGSNQLITGVLYEIQAAQQSIRGSRFEQALQKLETTKQLLRMIEAENRRIISGLHPPLLDSEGLVAALRWHTDTFQEQYGINCTFRISGVPTRLSPEIEMAIYRIAQESLNNVAEHARASNVHVQIEYRPTRLQLAISDDGIGFDPESEGVASANRMGVIGMRERAESIGGFLKVKSNPGQGTRISVKVPLQFKNRPERTPA